MVLPDRLADDALFAPGKHELPDPADPVEAQLPVELLRPVALICDQEDQIVAALPCLLQSLGDGCPGQTPLPEPAKCEDILDLCRLPVGIELAVARDLPLHAGREEPRVHDL